MNDRFFVTLKNRGLIRMTGVDREKFLQNLITQDIQKLETQDSLYACLLNAQGKFLHDFFITRGGESDILIDCEGGARADDLARKLTLYKLRADIEITVEPQHTIYAVFNHSFGTHDPRHSEMGWRSFTMPENIEEKTFDDWDSHRIALTIPDGSRDMIPEKSTLLESHIDRLNGIDFKKGCYIGQELTARMHYRGLTKKHLHTIEGVLPPFGTSLLSQDGNHIGEMRSHCGGLGLALIKDDELNNLQSDLKPVAHHI